MGPSLSPDVDLIMRTWRIDCGKATPEDLRKQRNYEIRQWIVCVLAVLVLLAILYSLANMSF